MMDETASAQNLAIVAVGDELIAGRTVDTNSAWLARTAFSHGWRCVSMQQVGDDPQAMRTALTAAAEKASLVLITGGLGPTVDDRTRQVLAEWLDVELIEDADAWQDIQDFWRQRGIQEDMPACNRQQALRPVGARCLPNERGTAPGILAVSEGRTLVALPGVPHEMRGLAERFFADDFSEKSSNNHLLPEGVPHCRTFFAGIGESTLQEQLGTLTEGSDDCRVGVYCHDAGHLEVVTVGLAAAERAQAVRQTMAPYVLPEAGLAASLLAFAQQKNIAIAVAESCTGGLLSGRLTAVPGASEVLREGVVAYTEAAKANRLDVSPALIAQEGVVSEAVAQAMAVGLAERHADEQRLVTIATTGFAGPGGGTDRDPIGTVYVAVVVRYDGHQQVLTQRHLLRGDRHHIISRAAARALLQAWQAVQKLS